MSIQLIISCILYTCIFIYLGNNIYKEKIVFKNKITIITLLTYTIFILINCTVGDKLLKTLSTFTALIFLYKLSYRKDWSSSIDGAIRAYLILLIAETIYGIIMTMFSYFADVKLINIFMNSIIVNAIIAILIWMIVKIINKYNKDLLKVSYAISEKNIILLFFITLVTLTMLMNNLDIRNWVLGLDLYLNVTLILIIIFIIVCLLIQNNRYNKHFKRYSELAEYSTINDEVLEEYRIKTHEYKNQLAIIKSMIEPKNTELNEYVDNLIEKNKNSKYSWINQVKYIKLPGLKGLLNYNIMEFNSLNINNRIIISKELSKENFNDFTVKNKDDLYSIVGVYLDNAKEAALESKNREVSIDITKNDDYVIIKIANSYDKNKINPNKMDEYSYSTKGKNRGIGLFLVQKVVNKNKNIFRIEREITKTYFIQKLYIKIK